MTIATVARETTDDPYGQQGEHASPDEEGDPPEPRPLAARTSAVAHAGPNGVWFGPRGSESVERESIAFLGSHNGVAVLQWPRDADRAARFSDLGIPCLWFVQSTDDLPPIRHGSEEWLPQTASDLQIHECLEQLCGWAAARRAATPLALEDDGWLHLGEHGVRLTPSASRLATILIAHFGEAVDDALLSGGSGCATTAYWNGSVCSDLLHLDQYVNPLGLEVVPAQGHAHLIRRCRW